MKLGISRVFLLGGAVTIALVGGTTTAVASPQPGGKTVSYLGLNFTVPADWPVVDLSDTTCVRFDRHAVYLGTPGARQDCPTHPTAASTEALLVQPAKGTTTSSVDNTVSRQITVTTPSVSITASYDSDRAAVTSVLASAGLPAPTPAATARPAIRAHVAVASVPASATNFTGAGFDACDAPAESSMSAWKSASPYSAVGIYIGGPDAACPRSTNTNLTAQWVTDEYNAGWRFLPIYVGVQAKFNDLTDPVNQGTTEGDDAAAQAQSLGLPAGSVLYDDMEGYATPTDSGEVLAFESAWVAEVHKDGYFAAIYGSGSSTMADLVAHAGGSSTPDAVYDADWNGQATTDDPTYIPAGYWEPHQRVHQYASPAGGETYGGVHLSTDDDYLDVGISGGIVPILKSSYTPTTPTRLMDTELGGNDTVALSLGLPSNVTSVVLNVTETNPSNPSYLTAFPDGVPWPGTSSLDFSAGETIANLVTVPVYDGAVDIYNHIGSVEVIADLFGYYTSGGGSAYNAMAPFRVLDTRNTTSLGAGGTVNVQVGGVSTIPTNVSAVIVNLTAVDATSPSYLTAYASGTARPVVSNLDFAAGQVIPNLAIVPVNNGMITIFNHVGTVDVLADVQGYFTPGGAGQFTPAAPVRLMDTRNGSAIGPGGTQKLTVAGVDGIPSNVSAVVLNVTAVNPTSPSYLVVYPDGQSLPGVSNLNYFPGDVIANAVVVPVVDGAIDFYNHVGSVNVLADLSGYYTR